ncbi:hypothetical protein KXX16_008855 [Aspergillus fumigatus]|nr:hypothetical protein KXX45_002403 [Aspergillus fumigatus]KAH1398287.1 hypothetical protein KXX49_004403 [Aspergillus fumigatus]KAH1452731.1 hypothetical protein KXX58_002862 [Aspergillus fumigatus]KAH1481476.1 hypothetical protein KXX26_007796 [Aspergillus fumigatus]KAH1532909.1 hypothetical protein KXX61_002589 [Aspergillus fumigatus]
MEESAESANGPGESPKQATSSTEQPAPETIPDQTPRPPAENAPETAPQPMPEQAPQAAAEQPTETSSSAPVQAIPALDTSLPPIDKSMPAVDTTLPPIDTSLPSLDSTLPPLDSNVPSLPPIDTSLPPLDTTLPAAEANFLLSGTRASNPEPAASESTGTVSGASEHLTSHQPQASTPSAIQPAPNPAPSLVVNPQDPTPSYPSAPPGYVPAASQPFAPSLHSESPSTSTDQQYDYGASSADPSLGGNNSTNMASAQNVTQGGLQPTLNATNATVTPSETSSYKEAVKRVQISDLLALRGIPPPPPHPITSLPPNRLEEIKAVFLATYAPAIDRFFETRWFSEKALGHLLANAQLMAEYSALIDAFNDRNLSDPNVVAQLESFEASVVWSTMTLCRHVMNVSNGSHGKDFELLATASRLDVIEALITGEHMERNPLAQWPVPEPAADPPTLPDQLMRRALDFWSSIGHFLTLHDNEASSAKEIDDTLARCRTLLDTYENRDVIYSIAIARHIGQRWADFPHSLPQHVTTNEKDAGAKLYVAQKFLEQEASGKGTTQVVKRICGMVVRSWYISRE